MRLLILRRITAVLLGLVLALGTAAHGAQAAAMDGKMSGGAMAAAAMGSDMSTAGDCDACADPDGTMTAAACAATCVAPLATLIAPQPVLEPAAVRVSPASAPLRLGLTFPPDLSPPRPASLS